MAKGKNTALDNVILTSCNLNGFIHNINIPEQMSG